MFVVFVLGPLKNTLKSKPSHAIIHTLIPLIFQMNAADAVEVSEALGDIRTTT